MLTTYLISKFLNVNMVTSNNAVLLLLLWRVPRDVDRCRIDSGNFHVLRLPGHCGHIGNTSDNLSLTYCSTDLNALSALRERAKNYLKLKYLGARFEKSFDKRIAISKKFTECGR